MSLSNGGSSSSATACAACQYQRKRCTKSCLLAPYFPQERQQEFRNAHKVFGVSYMTKLVKGVEKCHRDTAMRNLIFHANVRAADPVGGLYKIICDLKRKIDSKLAELNIIRQKLALCRSILGQAEEFFNVDGYDFQNMLQQVPFLFGDA